jgi:hypothetical protein
MTLAALMALVCTPVAAAEDGKHYPGTFCRVADNYDAGVGAVRYDRFGKIINNSSNNRMRIVCPILRDEINTTRGLNVTVYYHANNAADPLACELREVPRMADREIRRDRFTVVARPSLTGPNQGAVCNPTLLLNGSNPNGFCGQSMSTSASAGQSGNQAGSGYTLVCGLPARDPDLGRSAIASYFVIETTQ